MRAVENRRIQDNQTASVRLAFCFVAAPWVHPAMPQIDAPQIYRLAYEAAMRSQNAQRCDIWATGAALN
jgi:hypothetical protein